jgi:hypothetical protein
LIDRCKRRARGLTPYTGQIRWLFEKLLGPRPGKVLAGQVDHRGRTAVGDDEMVVCVSRANGGRIVIDA